MKSAEDGPKVKRRPGVHRWHALGTHPRPPVRPIHPLPRPLEVDDHLTLLCAEFESWYNAWRPHMTLEGLRPDDLYYSRKPEMPNRGAKTIPGNIERHVFAETRLTAYRLKNAA